MIERDYSPPIELARVRNGALVVGALLLALLLPGLFINRDQFFHAYLMGFIFWTGITLGSLALLMLQHLTGGQWGLVIRRVLEAATRTLPLMIILFVPLAVGLKHLYSWTKPEEMARSAALLSKSEHYLKPAFFIERAVIYFAIWLLLAYLLNRWSLEQDHTAEPRFTHRMKMLSGPGLGLFVL